MVRRYNTTSPLTLSFPASDSEQPQFNPFEDSNMANPLDLALRPRTRAQVRDHTIVEIYPHHNQGFLVSVQPPKAPVSGLNRASCDIVLVIDVSGSMADAAPMSEAEDGTDKESAGLSVLDLVKHAARTILETLGPEDRLGIVTFSDDATVIQELTFMSDREKKNTQGKIEKLRDYACTNLWAGIRTGLELFSKTELVDNIQGLFVLTDGQPNHMCPKQGYVNKLGPMLKEAASARSTISTIHTFGFGYGIRSDLMQSIASVGKGSYAFIPDAGMIGTAFVHAVANIYTTAGTSATLEMQISGGATLEYRGGLDLKEGKWGQLLELGNIQYGQSRDLFFDYPNGVSKDTIITATLNYKLANGSTIGYQAHATLAEPALLPQHIVDYHMYRTLVCEFLSALFPLAKNNEHAAIDGADALATAREHLSSIINAMRDSPSRNSIEIKSLLDDLDGDEPFGQVTKALTAMKGSMYWRKWGRHYLPSLLHAHQRQACNTFKDPGPLLYGKDSPLFIKCRTELDAAFDNLPAPKPSRPPKVVYTYNSRGAITGTRTIGHTNVSMRSYNSNTAPCFEGNCLVKMGDGGRRPIKRLRPGMSVWTPLGARAISAILRTDVRDEGQKLCRLGELLVTPWHPIKQDGSWVFPAQVAQHSFAFKGSVYSLLLTPHGQAEAHAIEIGGKVCVTLGHGLVARTATDVRAHPFFGSYRRVALASLRLPMDKNQHLRCGGMLRDAKSGLASGFIKPVVARSVKRSLGLGMKMRCRV